MEEDRVRFAVYDSAKNFLGYKMNTGWDLTGRGDKAKTHSLKEAQPTSHLFENLMFLLNHEERRGSVPYRHGGFDKKNSLIVVSEDLSTGEVLGETKIGLNEEGEYVVL